MEVKAENKLAETQITTVEVKKQEPQVQTQVV